MYVLALLSYAAVLTVVASTSADDMRIHLNNTISSNYYTYVRPVIDQSDVVKVTADLYLIGINDFDNAEQMLTTTAYLEIKWKDEILARDWSDAGIDTMYVPQNNIWVPDLALHNGFETLSGLGSNFLYLKVEKAGDVTWRPFQIFESSCEVHVTFFPFDKTTCDLNFVIWSNSKTTVTIEKGSIGLNTDFYETNSEWDLLATSAKSYTTSKSTGVTFSIEIKRKPLHYLLNILLPVIMLGILNVFVFVLPASSGEKTGYSVTAFLSFAVFLTIISTELPRNSTDISTFSAYLFIMTLVSTIMVVFTLIQLRISVRDDSRPVSRYWNAITRCTKRVQCALCIGSDQSSTSEKGSVDDGISWEDVTHAIDFVGFWSFLLFMVLFTAIILIVSTIGASNS